MAWIHELYCPPDTVVPMSRYCQRLHLSELDFWGVYRGVAGPMDPPSRYWLGTERRMLGEHIRDATNLIESFMRVHLEPSWNEDEELPWNGNPHELEWKRFIAGGKRATSTYGEELEIDYTTDTDRGIVTVAHGGVGSSGEVRCWYDDTELPIEYDSITWGATNIVLTFPKERLVSPTAMATRDNDNRGLAWELDANFLETLTVGREYHDASEQGEFITQACNCGSTCSRCCQTACLVAAHPKVGAVNLYPATYSGGSWARAAYTLHMTPDTVRYSYKSGLSSIPYELEDAAIRLAHTLMPDNPCPVGRDPQHHYWIRDRKVREIGLKEYLNCPWGNMDGAWWAWNAVANHPENYGKGGGFLGGMESAHRSLRIGV